MAWNEYLVSVETFAFLAKIDLDMPCRKDLKGWERDPITAKQERKLHALGLGYSRVKYKGQAFRVIREAEEREKKGLAKPIKMKYLYEKGVKDVHTITEKEANRILNYEEQDDDDDIVVLFKYDGDKIITACSKEDAHATCVWLNKNKYKYAYKVI